MSSKTVTCPVCSLAVLERDINAHLDNNCADSEPPKPKASLLPRNTQKLKSNIAPIFGGATFTNKKNVAASTSFRPLPASGDSVHKRRAVEPDPISDEAGPSSKRGKFSVTAGHKLSSAAPLAEQLRPQSLQEFVGQPHLTAPESLLMGLSRKGSIGSMIFWGPPGSGKTTLARLLAKRTSAVFKELSATDAGIAEVRAVAEEAKGVLALTGRRTILFLDEVHRFNKAQQDIFLPYVEQGILQLIGATTENPSFKLTGALLSRCRVFVLERLTDEDMRQILTQAVSRVSPPVSAAVLSSNDEPPSGDQTSSEPPHSSPTVPPSSPLPADTSAQSSSSGPLSDHLFDAYPQLTSSILSSIISLSAGDARAGLSLLELVLSASPSADTDDLQTSLRRSVSTSYDRSGDDRYDMISALHKSVRGSDGSAAMYWLARMLSAGEDPLYIARRMAVCASEDIGLADNHALPLAMATLQACQIIGMPECRINLAHLVAYLAEAPKSTRAYRAYNRAEQAAKSDPTLPVPMMVRNAPTRLMKDLGYGDEYHYNPDYMHPVSNEYLPPQLKDSILLKPKDDLSDKMWDENALQRWETIKNDGRPWSGREKYEE